MKNFIIKVIRYEAGFNKIAEDCLNNPPNGYEVFNVIYTSSTEGQDTHSPAAYRIIYKLTPIEPE